MLIIFLLVKKFLFKPVNKMLDKRKSEVDDIYQQAEEARAKAEKNRIFYTDKLDQADTEADRIIKDAVLKGNNLSDDIVRDAHNQADVILSKARKDIAMERKKTFNELKDDISDISFEIAEKMIGRSLNEKDQDALIDKFINEIGDDDE